MKFFITGSERLCRIYTAAGFCAAGHKVFGMVRKADDPRARELMKYEIQLVEGDLKNPESYREYLHQADAIVHTVMDRQDPEGTDNALFAELGRLKTRDDAVLRDRVFVYTTGCSILGKVPEKILDETTQGNPDHVLHFRMKQEQKVLAMTNLRKIILRPGFMYGNDGRSCFATQWFAQGEAGKVVYRGDRDKGWSWVHVADLARGYLLAAESKLDNEIFFLADEQRPKCLDAARESARAAGFTGEIEFAAPDESDLSSTWFDQNEFVTSQKANRLLGWYPLALRFLGRNRNLLQVVAGGGEWDIITA